MDNESDKSQCLTAVELKREKARNRLLHMVVYYIMVAWYQSLNLIMTFLFSG